MKDFKPETIKDFIDGSPEESQKIMVELRQLMESTVPDAEGGISWNVPIYKYHGILAGFSLAKKHVSFGIDLLSTEMREVLEEKGYKTGKKTIQIKFDQEVPFTELKQLILEQAKSNEI